MPTSSPTRGFPRRIMAVAVVVCALAGCGTHGRPPAGDTPELVLSPNGEPLTGGPLGTASCPQALGRWMDRVDTDRDGTLSRAEYMADAKAQFHRMDRDHDGFITADEVSAYRLPYLDSATGKDAAGKREKKARRGEHALSVDAADPVMSADTNLDFQVSPEEFQAMASDAFAKLDTGKTGRVTREALLGMCQPKR